MVGCTAPLLTWRGSHTDFAKGIQAAVADSASPRLDTNRVPCIESTPSVLTTLHLLLPRLNTPTLFAVTYIRASSRLSTELSSSMLQETLKTMHTSVKCQQGKISAVHRGCAGHPGRTGKQTVWLLGCSMALNCTGSYILLVTVSRNKSHGAHVCLVRQQGAIKCHVLAHMPGKHAVTRATKPSQA